MKDRLYYKIIWPSLIGSYSASIDYVYTDFELNDDRTHYIIYYVDNNRTMSNEEPISFITEIENKKTLHSGTHTVTRLTMEEWYWDMIK